MNWKDYGKRVIIAGACLFSLLSAIWIVLDIYFHGRTTISTYTLTYLAIACIFICLAFIILAYDLYKMKK